MKTPPIFFTGKAKDLYPEIDYESKNWQEDYIEKLESDYNEKDCFMCKNKTPEEGIVLRIEDNLTNFEAYKLKSFSFLEKETKMLDKGLVSIEEEN